MRNGLLSDILNKKKSVRELIDESVIMEAGIESEEPEEVGPDVLSSADDGEYRHLFVRRWHDGDDKPYKRVKLSSAPEAISLFFQWLQQYKHDKVEIWTDVAADAKNFYRFCLKDRENLEELWKGSIRMKKELGPFVGNYRDIQVRSRKPGTNLIGTLYPFNANAPK